MVFSSSWFQEFFQGNRAEQIENTSFGRITVASISSSVDKSIFNALHSIRVYSAPYHGIFIDDHTTPKGYDFERKLKIAFQCNCVLRLDSKSTQLLQLCDLMLNLAIRADSATLPESRHKAALVEVFRAFRSRSPVTRVFTL
jgi:hypothetical protein